MTTPGDFLKREFREEVSASVEKETASLGLPAMKNEWAPTPPRQMQQLSPFAEFRHRVTELRRRIRKALQVLGILKEKGY